MSVGLTLLGRCDTTTSSGHAATGKIHLHVCRGKAQQKYCTRYMGRKEETDEMDGQFGGGLVLLLKAERAS
jgi:hypothetical protein